jgi:prolyl-tRNA synthetase
VKGAPIIMKLGAREIAADALTFMRRDTHADVSSSRAAAVQTVGDLLQTIQSDLFQASKALVEEETRIAANYEEFKQLIAEHKGFVKVYWHDNPEVEARIKTETKAVSRCQPLSMTDTGPDFMTGEPGAKAWVFAQSY